MKFVKFLGTPILKTIFKTTAFVSIEIEAHFERKRGKSNYCHY